MKFKDNLAKEWEEAFRALPPEQLELVKQIVADNTFKDVDLSQFSEDVQNILRFYLITRDMAKDMVID